MRKMTPRQYGKILYDLTAGTTADTLQESIAVFAQLLRSEGMSRKIDAIISAFIAYTEEQNGTRIIEVASAQPVSAVVERELKQQFGADIRLKNSVEPAMIGGIIVRDGDTIFDASIRMQLAHLKTKLISQS